MEITGYRVRCAHRFTGPIRYFCQSNDVGVLKVFLIRGVSADVPAFLSAIVSSDAYRGGAEVLARFAASSAARHSRQSLVP